MAASAVAKFSDQTLKFTVNNAGLECLWLPVPYTRRQSVKPWITGTLKSSAEGLSGLATFFLVKVIPLSFLSLLVLAECGIWVWTLVRMKGFCSRALEEALRSRSLEYSDLQMDAQGPAIAAETPSRVAQVAEEVSFSADPTVYWEGDPGTALFLVASEAVAVTTGSTELAVLRRGKTFGEMAVLNRDIYRAGEKAAEDTVLLRMEQDARFDLMQAHLLARRVVQLGDLLREPGPNAIPMSSFRHSRPKKTSRSPVCAHQGSHGEYSGPEAEAQVDLQ